MFDQTAFRTFYLKFYLRPRRFMARRKFYVYFQRSPYAQGAPPHAQGGPIQYIRWAFKAEIKFPTFYLKAHLQNVFGLL